MTWALIDGTNRKYEYEAKTDTVRNAITKRTVSHRFNHKGTEFVRLYIDGKKRDFTLKKIAELRTAGHQVMRICPVCGTSFVPKKTSDKFCSHKCKKKNDNVKYNGFHVQRARRYGVPFERGITLPAVIERFGGVCQICGKQTDKRSFALQPTIDHIVPMRRGGGHTWDNVQLACFKCNSIKAADECDEELATA